jgi:NTP pyrophosphatase (non-canonical NTP hydrolase)
MNLNEYQEKVKTFALPSALNEEYLVSGLVGEAGEVAGKYAKKIRDGVFDEVYIPEVAKELGDVLWFIAVLSDYYGIDLNHIAQANVDKLASRQARNKITGSGDNR